MQWAKNVATKKLINIVTTTTKSTTHEKVVDDLVQDWHWYYVNMPRSLIIINHEFVTTLEVECTLRWLTFCPFSGFSTKCTLSKCHIHIIKSSI